VVAERDPSASYHVKARQRVAGSRKQTVAHLVNNQEDNVVGRLAAGVRMSWAILGSLRDGNPKTHYHNYAYEQGQAVVAEGSIHLRVISCHFSSFERSTADCIALLLRNIVADVYSRAWEHQTVGASCRRTSKLNSPNQSARVKFQDAACLGS
jgi:hypothetical protein